MENGSFQIGGINYKYEVTDDAVNVYSEDFLQDFPEFERKDNENERSQTKIKHAAEGCGRKGGEGTT